MILLDGILTASCSDCRKVPRCVNTDSCQVVSMCACSTACLEACRQSRLCCNFAPFHFSQPLHFALTGVAGLHAICIRLKYGKDQPFSHSSSSALGSAASDGFSEVHPP